MSCDACEQETTAPEDERAVAYYRWGNANIGMQGCHKHLREVFAALSDAQGHARKLGTHSDALLARIATLDAELEKARAERDALRALVRRALDENRCDHAAEPCSWCEPARAALESTPAPDVEVIGTGRTTRGQP